MDFFWRKLLYKNRKSSKKEKEIDILCKKLKKYYGKKNFRALAIKNNALKLVNSRNTTERLKGLEKLLYNGSLPDINNKKSEERIDILKEIIAAKIAKYSVEKQLEKQITARMKERQKEYYNQIKREIISKNNTHHNPGAFKKLARLEKMETGGLNKSTLEMIRPNSFDEIIGQKLAIKALVSKIVSPYPQHIILYGPPGVGKTTAARLTLQEAKNRQHTPFGENAKFVEVDGSTLRWDPAEATNPLLGSVHDPIYQGAESSLAKNGVPEPKTGLVTEAHGGILFIDEIGEMDPMLQNKLLKVMEDKRVKFESSYYNENKDDIPLYIKKLFKEGAPADFVLIGATTKSPQQLNSAFRSRSSEVFFNSLSREDIINIINNTANKLKINLDRQIPVVISKYTTEARKAINLLLDALSLTMYENNYSLKKQKNLFIDIKTIYEVIQNRRMIPNQLVEVNPGKEVGHVFGLGVHGFKGKVLEIEGIAFKAAQKGQGQLRFNQSAGSMARDSFFNATSVLKKLTGKNIKDYDIHVNIIGGNKIDGPSAGLAILMTIISAVEKIPLLQNVAVTGEVSIQGKIKPVGGIREKIYAAEQAGIKKIIIPENNIKNLNINTKIELIPVSNINEIFSVMNDNKVKLLNGYI